ncbi:MAG TPA: PHP domain-containing protein [Gammaproteobacteria bacterium]|nr:PHP domain-containing protein [Gammaproteobacteria bacterium]
MLENSALCYDLHSHSIASDGVLTPAELVARASRCGVDVLALTDHDGLSGVPEAQLAAEKYGIKLVSGVEISVTWNNYLLHIVGLCVDHTNQALQEGLEKIRETRTDRAHEMARRLEVYGIANVLEGVMKHASGEVISRSHFACFLIEKGYAKDQKQVFKNFLVSGKPGYVATEWATLEETINWIRGAGGIAVIAHPARYKMSATKFRKLLAEFKLLGGASIEVLSSSHSFDESIKMSAYAQKFDLYASQGSDFHRPNTPCVELGRLPKMPVGCTPVWESPEWRV